MFWSSNSLRYSPLVLQQLVVGAALDDPSLVQDVDDVAAHRQRQPVGDADDGLAGRDGRKLLQDLVLGLGVQGAGRLVQNQDRGVAEQRAGDGESLALATGEPAAALADDGVVAGRQRHDEVVEAGRLRGGHDLVVGRVELPHPDVVADGAIEEGRLLRDQREAAAEGRQRVLADVASVDLDRPIGRVVEAREHIDQGRLAGTGRPDERGAGPGRDRDRDVLERRGQAVGEVHALVGDALADGRRLGGAADRDAEILGLLTQHLLDTSERRCRHRDGRVDDAEAVDRRDEAAHQVVEADDRADRGGADDRRDGRVPGGEHQDRADQQDQAEVEQVRDVRGLLEDGTEEVATDLDAAELVDFRAHPPTHEALEIEDLDDRDGRSPSLRGGC